MDINTTQNRNKLNFANDTSFDDNADLEMLKEVFRSGTNLPKEWLIPPKFNKTN